jgi:hypothetical protein
MTDKCQPTIPPPPLPPHQEKEGTFYSISTAALPAADEEEPPPPPAVDAAADKAGRVGIAGGCGEVMDTLMGLTPPPRLPKAAKGEAVGEGSLALKEMRARGDCPKPPPEEERLEGERSSLAVVEVLLTCMGGGRGEEGEEVVTEAVTLWDTFTLRVIPGLNGMLPPTPLPLVVVFPPALDASTLAPGSDIEGGESAPCAFAAATAMEGVDDDDDDEEEEDALERGEKDRIVSAAAMVVVVVVVVAALGVEGEVKGPSCHPLSWLASHFCRRAFLSSAGVRDAGEDMAVGREGDRGLGERTRPPLPPLLALTSVAAPRGGERGVRETPGEGGGRNPPPPRGDSVSNRERPPER